MKKFRNRNNRNRIEKTRYIVSGLMMLFGLLIMAGVAGGVEQEAMTLGMGIFQSAIGVVLLIGGYIMYEMLEGDGE